MKWNSGLTAACLVGMLVIVGCGKAPEKQEATPELVDAALYVTGLPPGTMIQTKLTGALHAYHETKGHWPVDFNELVTAKLLDKVPEPPAGKKFLFDRKSLQVLVISE